MADNLCAEKRFDDTDKKFAEAEKIYRQAQALTLLLEPYGLKELGNIQLIKKEYDDAIINLTKAMVLGLNDNPYVKHSLAFAYISRAHSDAETKLLDLKEAVQLLDEIQTASLPQDFLSQIDDLLNNAQRNDYNSKKRDELNKAVINTGMIVLKEKRFAEAIDHLKSVLQVDPRNTHAYYCLGLAYHWAETRGNNVPFNQNTAYLMKAANNYVSALELGRPFTAEDYYLPGYAYLSFNNYWAIKFLKKAALADPSNTKIGSFQNSVGTF